VGVAKGRHVLVLEGESRKPVDDSCKFREQKIKSISQEDQVRVIRHIAAGGSPMDDSCSSWSDLAISTKSRVSFCLN
jgi:hypothetical protein